MKQNDFPDLKQLTSSYRYENFFNVYQDSDKNYFYNLLASINVFPANNTSVEDSYRTVFNDTWYLISYNYYKTMDLWWLVCEYNQIKDATKLPENGTIIKLLKPEYVSILLNKLNSQLNS